MKPYAKEELADAPAVPRALAGQGAKLQNVPKIPGEADPEIEAPEDLGIGYDFQAGAYPHIRRRKEAARFFHQGEVDEGRPMLLEMEVSHPGNPEPVGRAKADEPERKVEIKE